MTYPYNDEYMIFDEKTNRYVLTEKYVNERLYIDLQSRVNVRNAINAQGMIQRLLSQCSTMVYGFIHNYNFNNQKQDFFIAKVPSMRDKIMRAMGEQFVYLCTNGDLSRSTDENKRRFAIDENCKAILNEYIPELGFSILYAGRI